ncbi:MAG: hypothetical protein WA871_14520 [Candidatus Acidiferrales bacterium]
MPVGAARSKATHLAADSSITIQHGGVRANSPAIRIANEATFLHSAFLTKLIRSVPTLMFLLAILPSIAAAQDIAFKIPPTTRTFDVAGQPITVTSFGTLSGISKQAGQDVFKLSITADLSSLQQNITALLQAQLNRSDRCGDRIAIQNATLAPIEPASLATVQLHYERWVCAKVAGKQITDKLISGDAQIEIKLTPAVESDSTVRLVPEIQSIQADGSLGDLLRSGPLGDMLKQKISDAILSAMQKGSGLTATLPAAVQPYATIASAEFRDAGNRRLLVTLDGQVRIPAGQLQIFAGLNREHAPPN